MRISASKYKSSDITTKENNINILRDIDLLGHFDFQNLIITLDSINSEEISTLINQGAIESKIKILPLITHEYTHYFDSTSTIWGLNHLELMQNAYSINFKQQGQEKNFFHGKIFFDYLKRIKLPNYYTETGPSNPKPNDWEKINSIGLIFGINGKSSDYPVIFTNFIDSDKSLIARSPLSDLSLLECSATSQEYECIHRLISHEDASFQAVENHLIKEKLKSLLFNKNQTEYSVCTHLVLEKFFKQDIFIALKISGLISRFCLNSPKKVFDIVLRSKMLDTVLTGFDIDTKRRFRSALHNNNRGILFYLIVKAMPEINGFSEEEALTSFNLSTKIFGIPENWKDFAIEEAILTLHRIETGKNDLLKLVVSTGFINLRKTISDDNHINFSEIQTPPCYLSDLNQFHPFFHAKNKLNEIDCDYFFDVFAPLETSMFKFVEACAA